MFTGEIQRSRSKTPFVVGAVLLLLVVGVVLFMPFPRTVKASFTLVGGTSTDVKAPKAGKVGELLAQSGKQVASGEALLAYDTTAAQDQVTALTAKLDALKKQKPAAPKDVAKAKAAVKKAQAALAAAEKAVEKARAQAKGKSTPALKKAEGKVKAAVLALEKAKDKVRPGAAELKAQLAELEEQLEAAKAEAAPSTVVAPVGGVVAGLRVQKGAELEKDAVVAQVQGTEKLKAIVQEPAEQKLKKGMALELVLDSGRKKLIFDADAKDGRAEAEFDNATGALQPGLAGTAEVTGDDSNLLNQLLGR